VALTSSLKDFFQRRVGGNRGPEKWPFVSGNYLVLDDTAPIVIVMPDNPELAEDLAALSIRDLCMISPACRSASDIEKLIRNVESNLAIHSIVLANGEEQTYPAMEALCAIFGGDEECSEKAASLVHAVRGRLGSLDIDTLQDRIKVVDMLGCVDIDKIIAGVNKLGSEAVRSNAGFRVQDPDSDAGIERVIAPSSIATDLQLDKAGSYVIRTQKRSIVVEHLNSKGELLRIIEGTTARDICTTLIRNGWVSKLDHAAYLGCELTRAEAAVRHGTPYEQVLGASADDSPVSSGAAN
jgi:tetrahydromethanopterin S-methyltransferase subunit A